MADVKGVILNGAKYENQDTEARTLAGQAINQVETLENSVNSLETDVTALGQSVADVTTTATEAKSTATEANLLAQQAEARAQSAYELAEKKGANVFSPSREFSLTKDSDLVITEEMTLQLFGAEQWNETVNRLIRFFVFGEASDHLVRMGNALITGGETGITGIANSSSGIMVFPWEKGLLIQNNTGDTLKVAIFSIITQ